MKWNDIFTGEKILHLYLRTESDINEIHIDIIRVLEFLKRAIRSNYFLTEIFSFNMAEFRVFNQYLFSVEDY